MLKSILVIASLFLGVIILTSADAQRGFTPPGPPPFDVIVANDSSKPVPVRQERPETPFLVRGSATALSGQAQAFGSVGIPAGKMFVIEYVTVSVESFAGAEIAHTTLALTLDGSNLTTFFLPIQKVASAPTLTTWAYGGTTRLYSVDRVRFTGTRGNNINGGAASFHYSFSGYLVDW